MRLVSLCPFPGNGREAPGIAPRRVIRFHGLSVYWLNWAPDLIGWASFLYSTRIRFGYAITYQICSNEPVRTLEHLFPA